MPALSTITINDRETTPVPHAYAPQLEKDGVFTFLVRDGVPLGDEKLTVSNVTTQNGTVKVRLRLVDPILFTQTVQGIERQTLERTAYASVEFSFDQRSTLQERKNLVGKMANLLDSSQTDVMAICQDLEAFY